MPNLRYANCEVKNVFPYIDNRKEKDYAVFMAHLHLFNTLDMEAIVVP